MTDAQKSDLEFCTVLQTVALDAVKMAILEVLLIVQLLPTCHTAGKKKCTSKLEAQLRAVLAVKKQATIL